MTPTSNVPAGAPLEAAGEYEGVAGQRPWYARIGVALLTTALALVLTALLLPYLHRSIFLFLFVAVGVSAWYGGLRAGILAA